MIKQLAHICIRTRDLDATARFYCEGLGMERFFEFHRRGRLHGFYLKAGAGTFIEVFEGDPGEEGNIRHVALEVDDMDQTLWQLSEHRIEATGKKLGADHSWQAWITDPNGVRIELHQYTPESAQLTGRTCVVDW